ncbi:Dynein regulatory complex subunit 4 [Entophlyctis luteolus]|nr:Dynein regulatory complex subunit 4 [Entophlyctis luteolus]
MSGKKSKPSSGKSSGSKKSTGSGGKKDVASAPAADGSKSKEEIENDLKAAIEELAKEREERNYFQLERDKINSFWEITKSDLQEAKAELINKDRELEEQEEKHHVEIKVYKQKVKHLLYEYQNNVAHLQADSDRVLQLDQEQHVASEQQLKRDKRALKLELKELELSHEDLIKQLSAKHDVEITKMRGDFERRAKELMNWTFTEIKNYYNDITLNNLALINSLKEQVEEMKKKEERNEKQMADITAENKRLSEPLTAALADCDSLKKQLQHYEKDKMSLQNSKARLKVLEEKHKQLLWEHDVLEQRFAQVEKERNELYDGFVDRIIGVQQKSGFKNLILEKKVETLKETLEKKDLQLNEILKATNLDPTALSNLTRRLEEVLELKNQQIKELQYDLAKVTKAHNDIIRVYEAKLTEYSIPVEEIGFKPLVVASKAPNPSPAGVVGTFSSTNREQKTIAFKEKDEKASIDFIRGKESIPPDNGFRGAFYSSSEAGVGKSVLDLPIGEINMLGYAHLPQSANGIHLRLHARAFIFANVEAPLNRIVYVSTDIGFMSSIARRDVVKHLEREYLNDETGEPLYTISNLMISATHTHSGPGGFADEYDSVFTIDETNEARFLYQITSFGKVPKAREKLTEGILKAIQIAHSDLQTALLKKQPQIITAGSAELKNAGINRSPQAYMRDPSEERARYSSNVDQKMSTITIMSGTRNESSLKGHINWFAVHATSLHNHNKLVSGDNKGFASYIWELEETLKSGRTDFVAAFAQSNSGEDSGKDDFYAAEYIGRLQYEQGKIISQTNGIEVKGKISYKHGWVDMTKITVNYDDGTIGKTCKPALGNSFAAGTTDGKGLPFSYQGYHRQDSNLVLSFIRKVMNFDPIQKELESCHYPKVILLNTGGNHLPHPWQPHVLPLQIFLIGTKVALIGFPSEITTMAGRRLRQTVQRQLTEDRMIDQDAEVIVVGLANAYSSYVTTREEYQIQRYEGGSTIYGPHTLGAYQKLFKQMAMSFKNSSKNLEATQPPKIPKYEISLVTPVVLDIADTGKKFGDVVVEPALIYVISSSKSDISKGNDSGRLGDGKVYLRIKNETATARCTFVCAHPRNGVGKLSESSGRTATFMTVEKQDDQNKNLWVTFLTDAEWDTKFEWSRKGVAGSECIASWEIGRTVPVVAGRYRIGIAGVARTMFGGEREFRGHSRDFVVELVDV